MRTAIESANRCAKMTRHNAQLSDIVYDCWPLTIEEPSGVGNPNPVQESELADYSLLLYWKELHIS